MNAIRRARPRASRVSHHRLLGAARARAQRFGLVPLAMVAVAIVFAVSGCAERESGARTGAHAGSDAVLVRGTCVDAQTGEPLRGVEIHGPHDSRAVSDATGRFELQGLSAGEQGELRAVDARGRTRVLALRPLASGVLEVVVHLGP